MLRKLIVLFNLLLIGLSGIQAFSWYGKTVPFFMIPNHEVGVLGNRISESYPPLRYHDQVLKIESSASSTQSEIQRGEKRLSILTQNTRLTSIQFLLVAAIPWLCSLLYLIAALILRRYHWGLVHRDLLFYFNIALSLYLSTLFDFHSSHRLSILYLLSFMTLGILIHQLALTFPEESLSAPQTRFGRWATFFWGLALALPYLFYFFKSDPRWAFWEKLFILYASLGYIHWLIRLYRLRKKPTRPLIQFFSKYLFWGVLTAFLIPLTVGISLLSSSQSFDFGYAVPLTLIFPLSILLATLLAKLSESQARLIQSEKMASMGLLSAGLAHELNNPLNFISGNLETARSYLKFLSDNEGKPHALYHNQIPRSKILSEFAEVVQEMEQGLERSQEIIQLLNKMSQGHQAEPVSFKIKETILEALKFLEAQEPQVMNIVTLEIEDQSTLFLSKTLFFEIVLNLVKNSLDSLKSTSKGAITLFLKQEKHKAILIIEDQGLGIKPEQLSRIREPWFTTRDLKQGRGLGLALVDHWVHDFGGTLEIYSQLGKGTRVCLTIPQ